MITSMKIKVVFIAKTDLDKDGRILNELQILRQYLDDKILLDFIIMPDKPFEKGISVVNRFHIIKTRFRNNNFFRIFTVIEFTLKSLITLIRINPFIIHAQDTAVTLPVFIFKVIKGNRVKVIYDDHELPNEDDPLQLKLWQWFEQKLMARSEYVIFANRERKEYFEKHNKMRLLNSAYLLNLPYFQEDCSSDQRINDIKALKKRKEDLHIRLIIHQGTISRERGRDTLARFSKFLPDTIRILIVGIGEGEYRTFIQEFGLDENKFLFAGVVPYSVLNQYWSLADASIIMYMPTYLNNKLCAPNRLYISFKHALPIIVNKANPVLKNFVTENGCGLFIEDLNEKNIEKVFDIKYNSSKIKQLEIAEVKKFIQIYSYLLAEA